MKIKLIFILLLLSAFNVFGDDNKKLSNDEIKKLPPSKSINLEEKDVLTVCKGDDVTKWNNCWGKIVVDHPCDSGKWCGTWSKGLYYNGKKHGFFHEGIWNGRTTHRSDGIDYAGYYSNGIKVGLHGRCYYAQAGRTNFQIGNYNQDGESEGIWATYHGWYDDFPQNEDGWYETFRDSGCHLETALLYLNKEEPCGYDQKSSKGYPNLFTSLSTGKACRGIHASEEAMDYKYTIEYKKWLKMLEMHEK